MKSAAVEDATEVLLGRSLLVGMDELEKGLADKLFCLLLEMTGKCGVEVDELEVGGEERPVWNVISEIPKGRARSRASRS